MSRVFFEQDFQDFTRFHRIRSLVHRHRFGRPRGIQGIRTKKNLANRDNLVNPALIFQDFQDFTRLGFWCASAVLAGHGVFDAPSPIIVRNRDNPANPAPNRVNPAPNRDNPANPAPNRVNPAPNHENLVNPAPNRANPANPAQISLTDETQNDKIY